MAELRGNRDFWAMAALVAGLAVLNSYFGGLIPYHDGWGTDGRIYAAMAQDYFGQVFERGVWEYSPDYYFQRSLPSLLIYLVHRFLGINASTESIISGFRVLNFGCLIFSVWNWMRISKILSLSRLWAWSGFVLIFGAVAWLFVPYFYPTLTDTCVIALSFWLFAAFLEDKPLQVLAVIVLGSFVWPIFLPLGALLYLFPRGSFSEAGAGVSSGLRWILAFVAALTMGGAVVAVALSSFGTKYGLGLAEISPASFKGILGLSVLSIFVGYMAWVVSGFSALWRPLEIIKGMRWKRFFVVGAVFLLAKLVVRMVVGKATSSSAIAVVLATTFTVNQPGIFVVKHILYFGSGMALFYVFWNGVLLEVKKLGLGLWLFTGIHLLLGFDIESRHLAIILPVVVSLAIKEASNRLGSGRMAPMAVMIISVLCSLLWFWVSSLGLGSDIYHQYIWGRPDWLSLLTVLTMFAALFVLIHKSSAKILAKTSE